MKHIVIRIRRDGSIEAETQGLKGHECLDQIPVIESLCGAETVDSAFTREYYETPAVGVENPDELHQREQ